MSTALVLSGGGARGVGHVTALREIHDRTDWLDDLELVVGTSTGALVGAIVAQGGHHRKKRNDALKRLERVWERVEFEDVYARKMRGYALAELRAQLWGSRPLGFHKTKPLRRLLQEHLVGPGQMEATMWPVRYNLSTHEQEHAEPKGKKGMVQMALASASIPIYTEGVWWNGNYYVDGGVADVTPLSPLVRADGIDRAIVINLQSVETSTSASEITSIVDVLHETIEALTAEIFRNDLKIFREGGYMPHVIISPNEPLRSGRNFSNKAKNRTRRVMRSAAREAIETE